MSPEVTTVSLDPKSWYRGAGCDGSALLRHDGRRCCIGVAAGALGIPDSRLLGQATIDELAYFGYDDIPEPLGFLIEPSSDLHAVYDINDRRGAWRPEERVRRLNEVTEPYGLRFVLANEESEGA